MSEWKFSQIIEISIVLISFLAPIIISLMILYLVGVIFNESVKVSPTTNSGNQLTIAFSILGISLLGYLEIRLIRWLKK